MGVGAVDGDMVTTPDVYAPDPNERVSDTVIRALADSKDAAPTDLDVRLFDVIDLDALDALFPADGDAADRRVSFSVTDRRVVVDESRSVYVSAREHRPDGEPAAAEPQILRGSATPWRFVYSGDEPADVGCRTE